jgi:hypothetical protein
MDQILEAAEATRHKLREQGHSPIPVNGKRPLFNDWQKLGGISAEELSRLTAEKPDHVNTGALTALMPVLDLDIKDPAAAEAAEHLVRDRFGDTGKILTRVGSAPKRAIPFQTAKTFKKIAVSLVAPNGDTSQKIELLCEGQQVVVDGTHPDTGKPYTWFGGNLTEVSRYALPHLNEAEARVLVRDVVELLVTEHGYKLVASRPNKPNGNGHDKARRDSFDDLLISDPADDWAFLAGQIINAAAFHENNLALAAKLISAGTDPGAAINLVRGLMMQIPENQRNDRWYDRFSDIPRLVDDAVRKFGAKANRGDDDFDDDDGAPRGRTFAMMTSAEFVASYVPPDYLIEALLQRKFFYSLTGKTGSGKTAIALLFTALVALARGLDGRQFEQGRVLYFAGENPIDVQQRWIAMSQQMDFDYETIPVHFIPGVFKISALRDAIATEVEKLGGVALVIIDTTAAYFEGDEENDNVQAGHYARMQRSLVDTLPGGPTILALCHPVKNAGEDNILPRGGGAYLNEVDGNLTAQETDGVVQLHWQGKFRGPDFAPMTFHLRSVTHEKLKDTKGRLIPTVIAEHMSELAEKEFREITLNHEDTVLSIIALDGKLSVAEIAVRAGWLSQKDKQPLKSRVYRCLKALVAAKMIKQSRSRWLLTPAGKEAVGGPDD